jgi:hypothetical protein
MTRAARRYACPSKEGPGWACGTRPVEGRLRTGDAGGPPSNLRRAKKKLIATHVNSKIFPTRSQQTTSQNLIASVNGDPVRIAVLSEAKELSWPSAPARPQEARSFEAHPNPNQRELIHKIF